MKTNRTRLRREAIPGTVRFYPMRAGETVYGAMAVGEHRFYAKEDGKPEELVGCANYTHLMRLEGNQWRIARIFSFEHVDPP